MGTTQSNQMLQWPKLYCNTKYVKALLPVVVHRQAAGNVQAVHVEGRPTLDDPVGDDGAHAPGGGDAVAPHPRCHVVVVHLCGLA